MSTTKQKKAARKNLEKARAAKETKGTKRGKASRGNQLSTAEKNSLPRKQFAFPDERKEPLTDAKHVRNAIARFDQVEDVSDTERAEAWKRIKKAAKKYDVDIEADSWHDLMKSGRSGSRSSS